MSSLHPIWRWEPWRTVSIRDNGGPVRVSTDEPDPDFKPRPVGFTANIETREAEPLLWDGDDA